MEQGREKLDVLVDCVGLPPLAVSFGLLLLSESESLVAVVCCCVVVCCSRKLLLRGCFDVRITDKIGLKQSVITIYCLLLLRY